MEKYHLEILHDHYKESFAYIREREKQRDKLFLILIALFGLLFLEVQYPSNLQAFLKSVNVPGAVFNISALPVAIITSATWTVLLTIILRYSQISITIERQYEYLHKLEKEIAGFFPNGSIYTREGPAYLKDYPVFSEMVWIFYTQIFPAVIIVLQVLLIYWESKHEIIKYNFVYDLAMAASVFLTLVLYRGPQVKEFIIRKISKKKK